MSAIGRVLELSIASSNGSVEELARRESIEALHNPVKRLGVMSVHRISLIQPNLAGKALQLDARVSGLEYLGFGGESTIYRDGFDVIKVNRVSANLTEKKREKLAEDIEAEYAQAARHLSGFILPQVVSIDYHPLGGNSRTVQITQPYCSFMEDVEIFQPGITSVDAKNIQELRRSYPGIEYPLMDFVEQSYNLADNTNFFPDTNGVNNLVITDTPTPEVQLIDSRTLNGSSLRIRDLVTGQLDSLKLALLETA